MLAIISIPALLGLILWSVNAAGLAGESPIVTSQADGPNHTRSFTVTNASNTMLTGMTVRIDRLIANTSKDIHIRLFYDEFLNPNQKPLIPGQSYTFYVGDDSTDMVPESIRVDAALFVDGTAFGDPSAIQSLWNRRQWLAAGFQEVFHLFSISAKSNDREAIVKALLDAEQSHLKPTTPREERDSTMEAYETVIGNIRNNVKKPPQEIVSGLQSKISAERIQPMQNQFTAYQSKKP